MPFSGAVELMGYWNEYPPLHILARGYLGFKSSGREAKADTGGFATLASVSGGGRKMSKDRAPLHIQQLIADSKKKKVQPK